MKVIPSKKFKKKVAKLESSLRKALATRLCIFVETPFSVILNNHALQGSKRGYRSINITGDYRVIFEQYDTDTVRLVDVDTHNNLYGS